MIKIFAILIFYKCRIGEWWLKKYGNVRKERLINKKSLVPQTITVSRFFFFYGEVVIIQIYKENLLYFITFSYIEMGESKIRSLRTSHLDLQHFILLIYILFSILRDQRHLKNILTYLWVKNFNKKNELRLEIEFRYWINNYNPSICL